MPRAAILAYIHGLFRLAYVLITLEPRDPCSSVEHRPSGEKKYFGGEFETRAASEAALEKSQSLVLTVAAMITDDVAMDTFVESIDEPALPRGIGAGAEVEGADLPDKLDHGASLGQKHDDNELLPPCDPRLQDVQMIGNGAEPSQQAPVDNYALRLPSAGEPALRLGGLH